MSTRQASLSRKTNETQIDVSIILDCGPGSAIPQTIEISTGIGFLDHVSNSAKRDIINQLRVDVFCLSKTQWNVPDYEVYW